MFHVTTINTPPTKGAAFSHETSPHPTLPHMFEMISHIFDMNLEKIGARRIIICRGSLEFISKESRNFVFWAKKK